MKAILIRHGHTALNDTETYFSTRDPELSELGVKQVSFLVSLLQDMDIAAIFSSPMQRAVRTAQAIGVQKGLSVQLDDRLKEFDTGILEGRNAEYLKKNDPDFLRKWRIAPADLVWPEGESLRMSGQRIAGILREKTVDFEGQNVVFVSHGLAIKAGLCVLTGLDPARFRGMAIDPASYSIVEILSGRVNLNFLNVTGGGPDI